VRRKGLAVIHGHFYQPPRENPWTGQVDAEPSAAPDHDWNVRITREAYQPLAPLYEHLSFDFGPTLLDWMEREAPAVYRSVLRSDRGNAMASPYHHIILPLASRRDKETEVRWGIDDFKRRFGRDPEGFWLPETAVDRETLDVLAEAGIRFTVLAPHQVATPPERGLPATIALSHGRSIAVFVYDGDLSHGVAFGGLTTNADRFTAALEHTAPGGIATIAVDGETFGHHHKGGVQTLGAVVQRLRHSDKVAVTHFTQALALHAPIATVELVERTSWSCVHGIERWRAGCGCRMHFDRPSQQDWRTPLRFAVEWLAHEVHEIYAREGRHLPGGPRAFLESAGATGPVPGDANTERLVEMERGVLRAMTSCGWFFDDIAGLEGRQVLRYAAHAITLAGAESGRLEAGFIEQLGDARSNDPAAGSAADLFRQLLQPTPS
jgi:alpha-amylase/alpha-mannosidase (GH57 family)